MTARRDTNVVASSGVQANIGRRRSTRLAALAHTPPRASGSQQMGNVFVQSVPEIAQRLVSGSSTRQPRSNKVRTTIPRGRCDSAHGNALPRVSESQITFSGESPITSDGDDEDPLGDLERAAALESSASSTQQTSSPPENRLTTASPGNIARTSSASENLHVSPPRTPATKTEEISSLENNTNPEDINSIKICSKQSTYSTSSEEWTGDEEFLPLSVRKRHRAQRLASRQALRSPQEASRFSAQTRGGLNLDAVRRPQQSSSHESSHKASRFRTKGRIGGILNPEALQEQE